MHYAEVQYIMLRQFSKGILQCWSSCAGRFGVEWIMGRKPTEINVREVELPKEQLFNESNHC